VHGSVRTGLRVSASFQIIPRPRGSVRVRFRTPRRGSAIGQNPPRGSVILDMLNIFLIELNWIELN